MYIKSGSMPKHNHSPQDPMLICIKLSSCMTLDHIKAKWPKVTYKIHLWTRAAINQQMLRSLDIPRVQLLRKCRRWRQMRKLWELTHHERMCFRKATRNKSRHKNGNINKTTNSLSKITAALHRERTLSRAAFSRCVNVSRQRTSGENVPRDGVSYRSKYPIQFSEHRPTVV